MLPAERKVKILELLAMKKVITVNELTQLCNVSEMTIRRDLSELEAEGLLIRTYGGAMCSDKVGSESPFMVRSIERAEQKQAIAQAAAALVSSGDSVGIDVGTTTLEVARCLKNKSHITVVTSSLPVLNELVDSSDIELIGTGGITRDRDRSFVGHIAEQTLREFFLDKAFIGVAGISFEKGLTAYNAQDAMVKRVMIERTREVIVVADSSKFHKTMFAFVVSLDKVNKIITDKGISESDKKNLETQGIEVIIADKESEAINL